MENQTGTIDQNIKYNALSYVIIRNELFKKLLKEFHSNALLKVMRI